MNGAFATAALAALVLVPALVGVALLLAGRRADRLAAPVAVVTALVVAALALVAAVARSAASAPFLGVVPGGELALAVDGLSAVLVITVAVVAAAVIVFAIADLPPSSPRARFLGYMLVFTAAMLLTVTARTIPTLLIAWEIMGATSYALIGFRWGVIGKMAAGTTAFVTTRAADVGLYVAAGAVLAGTGSLRLEDLAAASGPWRDVAAAGILLAALGKSAQLPFSAWLSAAMEGPSPVSALLHSATMVAAGGYLLIRTEPLLRATGWAAPTTAWIGALTALVLGAVAAAQTDLKQLLAASTAAQIGFVVLATGVGATSGGTAQLVTHAAVKAGLFVGAGAWLSALGTKQLVGLRGAARRYRVIGVAVTVGALALAGVPPLALWSTKEDVIAGVQGGALRVVAMIAAALSALYAGKILLVVLAPVGANADLDTEQEGTRRVPPASMVVAAMLAVAAVVLGALALPRVTDALRSVIGGASVRSPSVGDLVLAGVITLVVLGAVAAWPRAVTRLEGTSLARWAGLRTLLTPAPWLAIARAAAYVDERLIDRAVMALATGTGRLAGRLGRVDVDFVDGAGLHIAAAARRAGTAMRRPQTGLLHQYYAQAVVGLALLFVVLISVR